jgi:20S proteasome alpha/beta subunit
MSFRLQIESEIDRERFPKFYVDVDEGPYVGIDEEPPDPPVISGGDFMTIAAGFCCDDGVVLAADRESSIGGITKVPTPKIFTLSKREKIRGAIAGAGNRNFIKMAVEMIDEKLQDGMKLEAIKGVIRDVMLEIYTEHLYPHPDRDRPSVSLLIGLWIEGQSKCILLETSKTSVIRVSGYRSIGIGTYLADCLVDVLCDLGGSIEDAALSAVCVFRLVKEYTQGCGGETDMVAVTSSTIKTAVPPRIGEAEDFFAGFLEDSRTIFSCLSADKYKEVPRIMLDGLAEEVQDYISRHRRHPIFRPDRKT